MKLVESFGTKNRSRSMGIVSFFQMTIISFLSYVCELEVKYGFHPLCFGFLTSCVSIVILSTSLEETLR